MAGFLYGTTTPFAGGLAIFLMIVLSFFGILCSILTWMNRKHILLKVRLPYFQLFAQIAVICWGVLVALQIPLAKIYPCFCSSSSLFIFALYLGPFYIMRCFKLYFSSHLTHAQIEFSKMTEHSSKLDWFVKNRRWASTKYMYSILMACLFLNILPLILFSIISPELMFEKTYSEKCSHDSFYFIILVVLYLIGIIYFTYKIWNIEDNYFIKKEFVITAIVAAIGLLPWATIGRIGIIQDFQTEQFPIVTIWSIFSCIGLFVCMNYPIFKIYKMPFQKISNDTSERNALEAIIEDPAGYESFEKFLHYEFAIECLLFWKKCKEFRKISKEAKNNESNIEAHSFAVDMIRKFLSRGAPFELNISGKVFSSTKDKIKEMGFSTILRPYDDVIDDIPKDLESAQLIIDHKFFDRIEAEVFALMYSDSFMRYKKSDFYTPYENYCKKKITAQTVFDEIDKKK